MQNHYSGKVVKKYDVITELRTTTFQSGKNANDLYEKLKKQGFDVKIKIRRSDKGEDYKRGYDGKET